MVIPDYQSAGTFRVKEIFASVQGEGYYTGTRAIFVRFAGCNLSCDFCDTDFEGGVEMTPKELFAAIHEIGEKQDIGFVVLTGGEPTLQCFKPIFITEKGNPLSLVQILMAWEYYIQIETNGTRIIPPDYVGWITCSPKAFGGSYSLQIEHANEVKMLIEEGDQIPLRPDLKCNLWWLQPMSSGDRLAPENIRWAAELLQKPEAKGWRLSIQTHKTAGLR